MSKQNKQCPEFPFFGASYPDARCIDGYLFDLDKCDENGNLYGDGDIPCPFCNTEEFIEYDPFSKEDEFYEGIEDEEKAKEMSREWYLSWINSKNYEICMCLYLLYVMAYHYAIFINNYHRIVYKHE